MKVIIKKINYCLKVLAITIISIGIWACSDDKGKNSPDNPEKDDSVKESTILIYAVATNSLSGNFVSDKNEMLQAAQNIDLSKNNIIVFETKYVRDEETGGVISAVDLIKLKKDGENYLWNVEKVFSTETASLDPQRIREVIDYVVENYKAENHGLVFWSHSTASQPYMPSTKSIELPMEYSFGQDLGSVDVAYEQINIEKLASAIPNNTFNFIWFDSCYMSNIESIYEFREKCDYYIGYPTEVWEYGLPYELCLPYMVGKTPDLVGAAENFFKYYEENPYSSIRNAFVAVVDMKKIEFLADFCKENYIKGSRLDPDYYLKYTRGSTGPFYDLGDYTKAMAVANGNGISDEEWQLVLDEVILYRAATPTTFSGTMVDQNRYSGISTHVYNFESNSEREKYFQNLSWAKTVFTR
ncbi:MAG: hypothetical protein J1F12_00155 [Muribaculaceae bacterium]|nr:hypothetical protein [Muribaculaceae bacterium]